MICSSFRIFGGKVPSLDTRETENVLHHHRKITLQCSSIRMMHKLRRTRCFSTSNKAIFYPVTILGGGPVGLFLSRLLREYEISHCLVERREQPRTHPQAHYLNMRTMEVLRTWYLDAFIESVKQTPPSSFWRYHPSLLLLFPLTPFLEILFIVIQLLGLNMLAKIIF